MKRQRPQTDETFAQPQAAAKGRGLDGQSGGVSTPPQQHYAQSMKL